MRFAAKALLLCAVPVLTGLLQTGTASARPEFARLTGRSCGACHVSAQGGGPLTSEGEEFRKDLGDLDIPMDPRLRVSTGRKLIHAVLYLLHIPFGVAWLGLFVYTFGPALQRDRITAPSRAVVRQMVTSVLVVAVTGPLMVAFLTRTHPGLFSTRFGLLLLLKMAAAAVLAAATAVLLWRATVLASRRYRKLSERLDAGQHLELDPDELALFSGQGRRRGLVAVEGRIYDVTGRNLWRRGIHPGGHRAGIDLTDAFSGAPHGREVFDRVLPVGALRGKGDRGRRRTMTWAVAAGLAASGLILVVLALWRW